jgi:hypothetical protein
MKSFEQLARSAFDAHVKEVDRLGGFSAPGLRKPEWHELEPQYKQGWIAAAKQLWAEMAAVHWNTFLLDRVEPDGWPLDFSPGLRVRGFFQTPVDGGLKKAKGLEMNQPITYDRHGRMNYHPEYHAKQGQPWTTNEQAYLINNYERLGPEEVSLALERTIHTVMTRAYELRKAGEMPKPTKRKWHRRSRLDLNTTDATARQWVSGL